MLRISRFGQERTAVALDGTSAEARYHLARVLLATGEAGQAEEHLRALERRVERLFVPETGQER